MGTKRRITITREQLTEIASQLDSRDFVGFAASVTAIDPVIGATVQMHAASADGNSPDVQDWVRHTLEDIAECDAETVEQAREWWTRRIGVFEVDPIFLTTTSHIRQQMRKDSPMRYFCLVSMIAIALSGCAATRVTVTRQHGEPIVAIEFHHDHY